MSLALTKRWNMDHKVLCFALLYFCVQAYGGEITDLTKLCSKFGFSLLPCILISPYFKFILGENGQPIAQSVKIEKVTMEHCDQNNDDVCLAHKGVEARGQIKFITTKKVETLTCSLYGKIGGVGPWIPFPGGGCPKNGCASLSEGKCPLSKGTSGTYDIKITPPTYAPDVSFLMVCRHSYFCIYCSALVDCFANLHNLIAIFRSRLLPKLS